MQHQAVACRRIDLLKGQIQLIGGQGMVWQAFTAFRAGLPGARLIMVFDLGTPLHQGVTRHMFPDDCGIGTGDLGQGRQLRMKQRQPVLHAGKSAARHDGAVEGIITGRRAKAAQIALAEKSHTVIVE